MELLFAVTGPLNYRAFQIINVLLAAGIVFFGFKTVRLFSKKLMMMPLGAVGYGTLFNKLRHNDEKENEE